MRPLTEKRNHFNNICIYMSASLYDSLKERLPFIFSEVAFIDTRDYKLGTLEPYENKESNYSIKVTIQDTLIRR